MIDLNSIWNGINKMDLSKHKRPTWVQECEVRMGLFVKVATALEILASFKGRTVRDYVPMQWEFEHKLIQLEEMNDLVRKVSDFRLNWAADCSRSWRPQLTLIVPWAKSPFDCITLTG